MQKIIDGPIGNTLKSAGLNTDKISKQINNMKMQAATYYTQPGDKTYVYSGTPGSWTAYKKTNIKKPLRKNFKSSVLDKAFKDNKLEIFEPNMSESLSRGSLYRKRYRRY